MTRIKLILLCMVLLATGAGTAHAQKASISTNAMDWANFGTVNLEAGVSVAQHFSLMAGLHYNPWEFKTGKDVDLYNKQNTGYFGFRWWPWYVFSGWWFSAKVQMSKFSRTGIWRPALEQGTSMGGGLGFGYTIMLHENVNLEFGAGIWGGRHMSYTLYECPKCMTVRESSPRNFIAPDDLSVTVSFVF